MVSVAATLYFILREQGMAAMKIHWKQDTWVALRVIVVVTVLVYGPIFLYEGIVRTIYPNLTIHQFCKTANFYASARNSVATGFQLFGGNTAGQNVRVGCAKSIPT